MATNEALDKTPKEVLIGPYRYSIGFDGQICYDFHYLGVCLNRSRRVVLDPQQADTELSQTFLHEILHALGNAFEIKEWGAHTTDTEGRITDKIDLMASALLGFIRENKEVIKWLQNQR